MALILYNSQLNINEAIYFLYQSRKGHLDLAEQWHQSTLTFKADFEPAKQRLRAIQYLSLCCTIISVWGIVQFILMGIFFFVEAAPLLDDFQFDSSTANEEMFKYNLKNAYNQRAYNCWIAAFLYVGLLVFAGSQFMTNQKQSSGSNLPTSMPSSPFAGITTEENGFNRQYGIHFNEEQHD